MNRDRNVYGCMSRPTGMLVCTWLWMCLCRTKGGATFKRGGRYVVWFPIPTIIFITIIRECVMASTSRLLTS